jgi:predicted amidophosphoribosyltransferase
MAAAAPATDIVTWVPTTPGRARGRGFDQAELLAEVVAARAGAPCRRLLMRAPGAPQTGRTRADRLGGPRVLSVGEVGERSVLLVDDVITSGATMAAAAQVLRGAGAREIHGIAAAATPRTLSVPPATRSCLWKPP